MKLIILSDIHANLSALTSVFDDIKRRGIRDYKFVILGDVVNYGLKPNETLDLIRLQKNILHLLAGNHEMALFGFDDHRFSSGRGKEMLDLTKELIDQNNLDYIDSTFRKEYVEDEINGEKYLFIHGSIEDQFWGTIDSATLKNEAYKKYDIVFSGHSHKPHFVEHFYSDDNPLKRDKKKTIFINPGSVGQPRNHENKSQYVIFDTQSKDISFYKCSYNIKDEQKNYDMYSVDTFYKIRLGEGV
jgi:predicted phosphodiesterase